MDLPELPPGASHALTAILSGGSSIVASVFRFGRRLKTAESKVKTLREEFDKYKKEAEQKYDALKAGWRLEVDTFKSDVERTIESVERQTLRDWLNPEVVRELQRRVQTLEDNMQKLRDNDADFVKRHDFLAHAKEQQEQWRQIERTLGQIEGRLRPLSPGPRR